MTSKEQRFFAALQDVFVGAKVEGASGFVNLMRIKARYYERGVFPRLKEDIDRALEPFPQFREELFDRLYNFFKRYFSESGSIYFRFTPPYEHLYEKVYTDDRDVVLFWKTHMLYYVKTDRLFRSMAVEVDGFRFFFDVSALEHKRANEKRTLVYAFKERQEDGTLVFSVAYSEKGKQTDLAGLRRAIKEALGLSRYTSQVPTEETLERAFRLFERQSEVDYFINKDARRFLREQFNLWLYQYVFEPEERQGTVWTERRIRQLQVLKEIAYKIIDFIAQFEDELVRVWNKPKFILGSHYVITLDRIMAVGAQRAVPLLERLFGHPGMAAQVQEWRDLGMVGEDFAPQQILVTDLTGKRLHERYQYLSLDTKHFPDLEMAILALFDHLDQELDNWLVHSENYQALNTMLPKFRERVKCIYIDPPYNTGSDEFIYRDQFRHSSWLTMMENRLRVAREWMREDGAIFVSVDDNEIHHLRKISDDVWDPIGTFVWEKKKKGSHLSPTFRDLTEYVLAYARNISKLGQLYGEKAYSGKWQPLIKRANPESELAFPGGQIQADLKDGTHNPGTYGEGAMGLVLLNSITVRDGIVQNPFRMRARFIWKQETLEKEMAEGSVIRLSKNMRPNVLRAGQEDKTKRPPSLITKDVAAYEDAFDELQNFFAQAKYAYPKPAGLVMFLLRAVTHFNPSGIILDFFAGSGTTGHAVINLNREDGGRRKYILVEMADYFHTVLLPRIKKVVFSDKWRDGKAQPEGKGISHFVKYFRLEQYEEVLRRAHYRNDDAPLFFQDPYTQYLFLRDPKMLDNAETGERVMEVDLERNEIRVDLSKLYPDIDLAETLSCLTGKWIRRIHPAADDPSRPGTVEFEDGTTVDLQNPQWELVKPLIWW
jgi:adenine-specific DNA-methyltransferase